jgi:Fe-S cluster biogenesis protein NfuA
VFIQTEDTPNPLTVKFVPGRMVLESGTAEYVIDDIGSAPLLVQKILTTPGITSVFLGSDFISVSKSVEGDWTLLRPSILGAIMAFYANHNRIEVGSSSARTTANAEDESEVVREIKELLETRIRPAVAQDGGDISFESFENGIVYVRLQGACAGCPSSTLTLKSGIENMLRHYIPEVEEVRAVE